jgi:hypothetical protein
VSEHEPTYGVSNTIDCACGETFSGPVADDVEDLYTAHKLGPKYEALMQLMFEVDEFDAEDLTNGANPTEAMLELMAGKLEETGWRFTP